MEESKEKESYDAPTAKVEIVDGCDDIMALSLPFAPMRIGGENGLYRF